MVKESFSKNRYLLKTTLLFRSGATGWHSKEYKKTMLCRKLYSPYAAVK